VADHGGPVQVRPEVLLEWSTDVLTLHDRDGIVLYANAACERVLGLRPEEFIGSDPWPLVHEEDRAGLLQRMKELRERPGDVHVFSVRARHRDGTYHHLESVVRNGLDDPALGSVLLSTRDVSDRVERRRAEAERREAKERLRRVVEGVAEGIVLMDADGLIDMINPAAAALLQLDPQEVLGRPSHPLFHHSRVDGSPYPQEECPCLRAAQYGIPARMEDEFFWRADGTPLPVEFVVTPLRTDEAWGAVLAFHDVSERLEARARLSRLAAFQSAVLDSLPALTAVVDRAGTIVAVNAAWEQHRMERNGTPGTCGVGASYLRVCDRAAASGMRDAEVAGEGLRAVLAGTLAQHTSDVACDVPADGMLYYSLVMVPLSGSEGGAVISYSDITERKLLEVAAGHRATHDVLTGLPNRTLLFERLEHALSVRGEPVVAVLFMDLDGFKLVNDGYGHDAGDAVLRALAHRLAKHVRPSDTVARLAGDEFVVLCEGLPQAQEAYQLAERIIAEIAEPFVVGDTSIALGASIGVALAGENAASAADLLRAADQAMLDAKSHGRNRFVVYDPDVHGSHHVRFQQAQALRRMLKEDRLLVHYQPVVDLRDGSLQGVEALLRWRGEGRLRDTATAIALAEEMGLIGRIGRFVLREASREAATFLSPDGDMLPLAINVAPQQLEPRLVADVERAAQLSGYPLSSMTLELTERSVMAEPALAQDVLGELRALGVRIALDDFGVGYSSLAYLRDLPLDVLKLDGGFVSTLDGPSPDGRIIRAIIQMADALGLDVVAEGIETVDQQDRLLEMGCVRGQGFLYSHARPAPALRELMR
jgi:diguanylate cyclase (GGDEF)-like protein/PAS domain S-box-containing protein